MNKKIIIILTLIVVSIIVLSGCINNENASKPNNNNSNNSAPFTIITAPKQAYFGNPIVFDASESYDPGGKIVSYKWDFRDGQTAEGKKVEHTFKFENEFDIEYPLIYTVLLCVKDNDECSKLVEHQIMLFPSEYIFYLDSGKIITNKPSLNEEKIRVSGRFKLNPAQEVSYELEDCIVIQKCKWHATIHMKKPILTVIDQVIVTLYNKTGVEISNVGTSFGRFKFWKDKAVFIEGETNKKEEFKSAKLSVYGFSLGKKISIFYGDDTASQICFDFTT